MREGLKKKIHEVINTVNTAIGKKRDELLEQRENEEQNPKNVIEAYDETMNSPNKEHKTSETTNSRLIKLTELERDFDAFCKRTNDDIPNQENDSEIQFYSDVQQYCSRQEKTVKLI